MKTASNAVPFLVFVATMLTLYFAGILKVDDGRSRGDDNHRVEHLERRQRELDDRIDALSSSLRAAVRPIGWDVPRDGGVR